MKSGVVYIIGRTNSGKSTLLNTIIKQKVAITSPKPQTTRFPIQAAYQDERGQIIFVDIPGIFAKVKDKTAKQINARAQNTLGGRVDVVLHLIDHTRYRDIEENRALGIIRQFKQPKLLIINKIDITQPSYREQYKFMDDEHDCVIEVSALTGKNVSLVLNRIFSYLPDREPAIDATTLTQPALNLDSKTFIAELIREKAFLFLRREVPYSLTVVVDSIETKTDRMTVVKARILTSAERYKAMIIGKAGVMIKEIGMATRKELEIATNKKVFLDLTVETNLHWNDYL